MLTITRSWVAIRATILLCALLLFTGLALADTPDDRIVGGQEADPGEWPWQVALVSSGSDPFFGQFCGGTLVNENWVLTAAHCVDGGDPIDLEIIAGIHDLANPETDTVRMGIRRIVIHPDWNGFTYDGDVALLELAAALPARPGGNGVLPIEYAGLVPADVGPLTGVMSTVTGWGNTIAQPEPGGANFPDRLHEVEVPIISNADCSSAYGGDITPGMICAAYPEGGKDSCQGDSGGPLVIYNENSDRWQLAGIVSWGTGCAAPNYPGVYARVSYYSDWSNSIINKRSETYMIYMPILFENPPAYTLLPNGDFEQGQVVWTEYSQNGWDIIYERTGLPSDIEPHSGDWLAWLGGDDNEISTIEQTVTVPQGSPHLVYHFIIASNDACGYDISGVMVNGSAVRTYDLCFNNSTYTWVRHSVDLSAFAGQPVELQFRVETDSSAPSNWFIDDVAFSAEPLADEDVPVNEDVPAAAKPDMIK